MPFLPFSFPTKDAAVEFFKSQIVTDPVWANRALEVIYAHQTATEQAIGVTKENNGVGFGGRDCEILSSFARKLAAWKALDKSQRQYPSAFSPKMQAIVHKLMPKYAAQLVRHLIDDSKVLIVKVAKNKPTPVDTSVQSAEVA